MPKKNEIFRGKFRKGVHPVLAEILRKISKFN